MIIGLGSDLVDIRRIERVLERHGAHLDDKTLVAVLDAVGGIAYWQGHEPQAIEYYSRCVAIGERIGDRKVVADAYYNLAFAVPNEEGLNYVHKAADAYREIGDELGLALALAASGDLRMRSTPDEAIPPLREAKSLLAKREDRYHYAWALDSLGTAYLTAGKAQEAESEFLAALEVFAAARDLSGLALVIDDVAAAALACGDAKRAVRLSAAAAKLTTLSGAELFKTAARTPVERMKSSGLPQAEADTEWAAGRELTIDEVVEYARQPACAERH